MQLENQPLIKLKSIAKFLHVSGEFLFQNYNLNLFMKFLKTEPNISVIVNNLFTKYPKYSERFKKSGLPDNTEINGFRNKIESFEENAALCVLYVENILVFHRSSLRQAMIYFVGNYKAETLVLDFYNECIEPILIYIELQIKQSLHALYILQRYKVFCEWYGKEELLINGKKEVDITKRHLARYLFDSGFTYPFVEVEVPSGRIDNLTTTPFTVIVEAKIHRNGRPQSAFQNVFNQAYRRTQDLNLQEAFCVLFNKEHIEIIVDRADGFIENFFYKVKNNSRIYFLVINLYSSSSQAAKSLQQKRVDLGLLT